MYRKALAGVLAGALYLLPSSGFAQEKTAEPLKITMGDTTLQSPPGPKITRQGPCSGRLEELIVEVTSEDVKEALFGAKPFTDFSDGEPLIHALATYFSDAKPGICYFVRGETLRKHLPCHKYFGNRKELLKTKKKIDGKDVEVIVGEQLCSRIPMKEMDYAQAQIVDQRVEVFGVYKKPFSDLIIDIPEQFRMRVDVRGLDDGYFIKFIQDKNQSRVKIAWYIPFINLEGMAVFEKDCEKSSNKKAMHGLFRKLEDKNLIEVLRK